MTYILRNLLVAGMLLATAACSEDLVPSDGDTTEGREAVVTLALSAAPIDPGTSSSRGLPGGVDEGTASDYKVKDFWLMEYNSAGAIVGSPQYYTDEDLKDGSLAIPIILPPDATTEFLCVVVANTHIEKINAAIGDVSTLDKLRSLCRMVNTSEDLHNKASGDLLMNCVVPVTSTTGSLDCKLYRNIAKLTLKLKNAEGSGVKLNTVQLVNVTDRMFYADRLRAGEASPNPTNVEAGFRTWEAEVAELSPGDAEMTLEYYLPRNCRGTNKNTSGLASEKNRDVPDFATFVEIMAEDLGQGTPIRYRFYLGENMTDNFDIVPNRHYTLPITIEGKGVAYDSRVEDMGTLNLPESNCYIVNPLRGNCQQLHSVPITRINKFWTSPDGLKAVNDDNIPEDNTVNVNTEWVAEVIWQDASKRLFDFCDKSGNILSGDTYTGKGITDFHFKPRSDASGNVLIGVRKASEDKNNYLWSWHLWFTDYNPDQRTAGWSEGMYVYSVAGGEVHRYSGDYWENNLRDKYIMDRNLGALTSGSPDVSAQAAIGFYYQYGRKDPIPYKSTALYDINGSPLVPHWTVVSGDCVENVTDQGYLYTGVKKPFVLFNPQKIEWVKDNPYLKSSWNMPTWWNPETDGKNLFDPSPPGWKIPPTANVWAKYFTAGLEFEEIVGKYVVVYNSGLKTDGVAYYPMLWRSTYRYHTSNNNVEYTLSLWLDATKGLYQNGNWFRKDELPIRPIKE